MICRTSVSSQEDLCLGICCSSYQSV